MTPSTDRAAIVEREFTPLVHKRLLAHARYRLSILNFQGVPWSHNSPVPGGLQEEDFVQQAVSAYLAGDRNWPDGITFEAFLRGVIRSLISNLVRSLENRSTKAAPEEPAAQAALENHLAKNWQNAEAESEAHQIESKQADAILGAILKDEDLTKVAEGLWDGKPPREIAAEMGLSALEVQNIRKRLIRKATEARKKLSEQSES